MFKLSEQIAKLEDRWGKKLERLLDRHKGKSAAGTSGTLPNAPLTRFAPGNWNGLCWTASIFTYRLFCSDNPDDL